MGGVRQHRTAFPAVEAWMSRAGVTQQKLAEVSGFNKRTISCYLNGDTPPHYYFILTVMQMSGMTFEEAFGRGENNGLS